MPDGVPSKASLTTFSTFMPRHSTLGVVVIEPYKGLLLLRQSGPKEAMPMNRYASYFDPFSAYWFCLMKLLILLCRKYRGRTICWNLFTSFMTNSTPEGAQYAILLNSSFCVKSRIPSIFQRFWRWSLRPLRSRFIRSSGRTSLMTQFNTILLNI